jgi:hypothetical protein
MRLPNPNLVMVTLGLGAVAVIVYELFANKATLAQAADKLNPLSQNNAAISGANRVTEILTGGESQTLGGWLWEKLHPDQVAAERAVTSSASMRSMPTANDLDVYFRSIAG